MRRAVFLDRDGVLNAMLDSPAGVDSPQRPEELRLLPGAAAGVRLLNGLGLAVVVVSNQPGIAKGKSTPELLLETGRLLRRGLAAGNARLDGVYYCLHHPDAIVPEYRARCGCRKPEPGLLLRASAELGLEPRASYMVGDQPTDIFAGAAAGCTGILVQAGQASAPSPALERAGELAAHVCGSLLAAARWIVERERRPPQLLFTGGAREDLR